VARSISGGYLKKFQSLLPGGIFRFMLIKKAGLQIIKKENASSIAFG